MKKNVLVRSMGALLCVCLLAGCSGNTVKTNAPGEEPVDVRAEEFAGLVDGYDPEVDDPEAERSVTGDVSLAGTVLTLNGEEVSFSNSKLVEHTRLSPNKNDPNKKITHRTHKIDTITIHCMAGQLTVETCGNVFADKDAKASSNYGVDKQGRVVVKLVIEKDGHYYNTKGQKILRTN